ncbi:hypothetical protein NLI96_g6171 [Meripilus lineatus]|uniref:PEBP-like protein n=1 Tax=Meripilus lineatus TaxID=2056292 RepID=A0AAD5V6C7_9APHY|nr:hypothetical protein NLI96_g6171 [Physisporinus lineatus]
MYIPRAFLLTLSFAFNAVCQDISLTEIPNDTSIVFQPSVLFEVAFPQVSGSSIEVNAGIQLPRNSTAIPPRFSVRNGGLHPGSSFVIAMIDLDAPTPQAPTLSQIRHFLGGNFHPTPGGRGTQDLVNSTVALSDFLQPTPPAGSDPHRYVFLLFNQPKGFNQQTLVNATTSVTNFDLSQFSADVGLGDPIGGTFILESDTLGAVEGALETVRMESSFQIPNDANLDFNPNFILDVTFPQAEGGSVPLSAGMTLPRGETAIPPIFNLVVPNAKCEADDFVLAMVDLDAPTPQSPTSAQIRHFLGGDFHFAPLGKGGAVTFVNSTPAISQYRQPTPPAGSDPHRYVFLVFNQPSGFDEQTVVTPTTSIANFNISDFAIEVGLGNPIAGNFMLVGPVAS